MARSRANCLKKVNKRKKNVEQGSRCSGRDSKPVPSERSPTARPSAKEKRETYRRCQLLTLYRAGNRRMSTKQLWQGRTTLSTQIPHGLAWDQTGASVLTCWPQPLQPWQSRFGFYARETHYKGFNVLFCLWYI
jgi:hypothetical protein